MKYLQSFISVYLLMLLAACCPDTSVQPLSAVEQAKYDKRLEGTWINKSDDSEITYFHVGKADANLTQGITVGLRKDGKLEHTVFTFFPTIIDNQQYLNVKANELFKDLPPEKSGYIIVRYKFRGNDIVSIYCMDNNIFAQAITAGQLKGKLFFEKKFCFKEGHNVPTEGKKKIDCVHLTDSSENILNFIKNNSPDVLFPKEILLTREKVD